MTDTNDFLAEDYRFTADLLRRYSVYEPGADPRTRQSLFRAVCSNNLNIILAALDVAADAAASMEADAAP